MQRPDWISDWPDPTSVVPFSPSVDHWIRVEFRIRLTRVGLLFNEIGIMDFRGDEFHHDCLSDHVKNA